MIVNARGSVGSTGDGRINRRTSSVAKVTGDGSPSDSVSVGAGENAKGSGKTKGRSSSSKGSMRREEEELKSKNEEEQERLESSGMQGFHKQIQINTLNIFLFL